MFVARRLPVVKGWTVDCRLRMFRKVSYRRGEPSIEYVEFDSMKGRKIIKRVGKKKMVSGAIGSLG